LQSIYKNLAIENRFPPDPDIEDNSHPDHSKGTDAKDTNIVWAGESSDNLISAMQANAEDAPVWELTPENWYAEFGESGMVGTPIGDVKLCAL
jgi:hypothetical protein